MMEVTETADVTDTGDIAKLEDAAKILDPERLHELRWYRHAEQVIKSNFPKRPEELTDSWLDRHLDLVQKEKPDLSLNIVISKLRTTIEANNRKTPTLRRIRFIIWLGLLARDWLEAEILKWVANQEYLLYQCRGYGFDEDTDFWLYALGRVAERRTPQEVHEELFMRLKNLEGPFTVSFDDAEIRSLIQFPDEWQREPKFLLKNVYRPGKRRSESDEINRNSQVKLESLAHLQRLEDLEKFLDYCLRVSSAHISGRRAQISAYMNKFNNTIESFLHDGTATCTINDLETMLKIIKLAKSGEEDDMNRWRRVDTWVQSVQINIGRLQNQLIAKRKNNHNRNKNKNRALKKKKKLRQEENMDSEADIDGQAEEESEETEKEREKKTSWRARRTRRRARARVPRAMTKASFCRRNALMLMTRSLKSSPVLC